jgi:NADH dehydrogenase
VAWATRSKRNRATGAGVELAAIIHDYLTTGLFRAYPWLVDEFVRIVIVGHTQRVLPTSKPNTSRFVQRVLEQEGIEILTATAITGVTETMV